MPAAACRWRLDTSRMQQRNGEMLFSPSDLNAFLECEHLTQLELAVARGRARAAGRREPAGRPRQAQGRRARGGVSRAAGRRRPRGRDDPERLGPRRRCARDRGRDARRVRRHLPGVLRGRQLARVRRLRRAAAGRPLRGRRHEARAPLEALLRAAALLLLGAGRADRGLACPSGCTSCSARTSARACASATSSRTTTACGTGS